jgi:hypothetical protein
MLKASQIIVPASTNVTLDVRGAGALAASKIGNPAADDAAGGGGGGGTVLVQLTTGWSLPGTLTINASGGKGGDNNSDGVCHGTGGGGGSGRIEVSGTNANLTLTADAGPMGVHIDAGMTGCATWGASNGVALSPLSSGVTLNQNINCTTTPVIIISFEAKREGNTTRLNWSTASEKDNDYFSVERSFDGINFEEIGIVKGRGTTKAISQYSFGDYSSLNGGYIYYRLKQVDLNNNIDYSPIRSVSIDYLQPVTITNDPNSSDAELLISFNIKDKASFNILDMLGRVVYSGNRSFGEASIAISKNTLGSGIYILKVFIANKVVSRKVILN